MKAIILAAGMGTRLDKYTKNSPKCMLKFVGKSLIEHQVEVLRSSGINNIIIVRGYMPDKINIPNIKYYINQDYATTNMVETLFCAESEMNDDIIVCYSDILYQKDIIKKILSSNADIGVTVDDDYGHYWKTRLDNPEEDVESLVIDKEGKIIELGEEKCDLSKAKFRYVGLIKFSKKGIKILKEIYHKNKKIFFESNEPWLRSKSFKRAYMTSLIQAIINEGYKVDSIIISRGWLEFDTNEDYERMLKLLKTGELDKFYKI